MTALFTVPDIRIPDRPARRETDECPRCDGFGEDAGGQCAACDGTGSVEMARRVRSRRGDE